jgi:anti-sigma factor ChrR (cupin superfamily)
VAEARQGAEQTDPELEAELQAHEARLREVLTERLPRSMWRAYMEACVALADGLSGAARRVVRQSLAAAESDAPLPPMGFRPTAGPARHGTPEEDTHR